MGLHCVMGRGIALSGFHTGFFKEGETSHCPHHPAGTVPITKYTFGKKMHAIAVCDTCADLKGGKF